MQPIQMYVRSITMKNEQMLKLSYETDMPAGDQVDCYLSCNVRINKGELKKKKKAH